MISRKLLLYIAANVALLGVSIAAFSGPALRLYSRLPALGRWLVDFGYRRFVVLATLLALAGIAFVYLGPEPPSPVIRADGQGYFAYLPAYVIYHDPTFKKVAEDFKHGEPLVYDFGKGLTLDQNTGNYLERYGMGEAVLMLPFFLAGHLLAIVTGSELDGYSTYEHAAAALSGLFYMFAGVWLLRSVLSRYFSRGVVLATLVSIVFGTSLFHYATYDSIFSHAYSFFLITLMVWLLPRFYEAERHRWRWVVALGVAAGLILLVRNQNVVALLLVPLFGLGSIPDVRARLGFFRSHLLQSAAVPALAAVVFIPQMLAWQVATGHLLVFSYEGSGGAGSQSFQWLNPSFPQVLIAFYPHGLLPWAPVLTFALVGLVFLRRSHPRLFYGTLVVLVLNTYVIASWFVWFYGGGFGHRQFIDTLALAALPLAAFYAALKPSWLRGAVFVVAGLLIMSTLLQMYHFWQHLVPIAGMPRGEYFRVLVSGKP
ncbi:MAG: hypothetical protein M3O87_04085 [Candidatus Dormibacteraeota bacterium]|nr:hypothetical protein [Candidatus Dormibacteraeota bacterium]